MLKSRVIPCLLLQKNGLVKTVGFEDARYVGDPINAVKIFNEKEVDELILLDIRATRHKAEPNFELLHQIASEAFMPLCYGGGITTLAQATKLIKLGVEKVAVNSSVLKNESLIGVLAAEMGSQSVVASIDVKKDWLGRYRVFDPASRKLTNKDPIEHALRMQDAGAGEVFLNNVLNDGRQAGYDLKLITLVADALNIPLIACGGAGNYAHLADAVKAGASAVAAGSLFVFQGKHRAVLINYPPYQELERIIGTT